MITEDQLIRGVINGDQKAIRHLLDEYQDYIYSICYSVLRTKEESEEATQDTFLKIIKALPRYVKRGKLSTWIYSVAYRTALDYLRKRKITEEIDNYDREEEADIEARITGVERSTVLAKLIDKLNPKDSALIRMHYFEEMSIKELANITSLSESNVKVKLYRSRKMLSQLIKKENIFSEFVNA